ncbi:hypothetical protein BDQ17DRAFT_1430970 [Cyathus striatus]|nr:hypothetical protein BDQ17DRAFT_1430970 [Cyathus striatus]
MSHSEPTIDQVRVANYVLSSIAVAVTCLRLVDRARTRKLWWDDAWAGVSILFTVTFMAALEIHLQDPARHSKGIRIAAYYLCAQCFYAVGWTSRLSILCTIIHVTLGRFRQYLIYVAGAFLLTWSILFAQVWWVCEAETSWKDIPATQCNLGEKVAIAQVITDVLSDLVLVLAPVGLVWKIRLTKFQKFRIAAIFSTTIITTAVSLYHAHAVLRKGGLAEALAATVQDSISLIVANLSVIITFLFRLSSSSARLTSGQEISERSNPRPTENGPQNRRTLNVDGIQPTAISFEFKTNRPIKGADTEAWAVGEDYDSDSDGIKLKTLAVYDGSGVYPPSPTTVNDAEMTRVSRYEESCESGELRFKHEGAV